MSYSVFGPGLSCFAKEQPGQSMWTCARFVVTDIISAVTFLFCAVLLSRKISLRCVSRGLQAYAAAHHILIAFLCLVLSGLNTFRYSSVVDRHPRTQVTFVTRVNKVTYYIRMLIPLAISFYVHKCFVNIIFTRQFRRCLRFVTPLHALVLCILTAVFVVAETDVLPHYNDCHTISWSLLSGTDFVLCIGFTLATVPVFLLFSEVASALNDRMIARMRRLFFLIMLCLFSATVGFVYDLTRLLQSRRSDCYFRSPVSDFMWNMFLEVAQIFVIVWAILFSFFECAPCAGPQPARPVYQTTAQRSTGSDGARITSYPPLGSTGHSSQGRSWVPPAPSVPRPGLEESIVSVESIDEGRVSRRSWSFLTQTTPTLQPEPEDAQPLLHPPVRSRLVFSINDE